MGATVLSLPLLLDRATVVARFQVKRKLGWWRRCRCEESEISRVGVATGFVVVGLTASLFDVGLVRVVFAGISAAHVPDGLLVVAG